VSGGRPFDVGRHDPHLAEIGSDFGQRGNPRAVDAVIVRDENPHTGSSANTRPVAAPFLNRCSGVNVWILCNEDAGRSLSDDTLRELVQQAGHTIVDLVTKASLRARPPHGNIDLVVAAGGDGTVKVAARLVAGATTPLAILPLAWRTISRPASGSPPTCRS
jgi:hypothetical protein